MNEPIERLLCIDSPIDKFACSVELHCLAANDAVEKPAQKIEG